MKRLPSPLTLLKSHNATSILSQSSLSQPFRTASTVARHLNTQTFSALLRHLAESSDVLQTFRATLFASTIARTLWPALAAKSGNLAALPPDVLADRSCFEPLPAVILGSRQQIDDHCRGLLTRLPSHAGDVALAFSELLLPFDVPLDRHVTSLWDLRQTDPKLAIAIMEDRTADAMRLIKTINSLEGLNASVRIVVRHWLLYRAFHLQRSAAYIASCRCSALPFVLPIVCFHDSIANTAFAYVEVLAKATSVYIGGYLRSLRTGGKAGKPGRTSLPVKFVRAVIDRRGVRPAEADQPAFAATLDKHASTLVGKIDGILEVVSTRRRDGLDRKASLYASAGLPTGDAKALTMFEVWHLGLSPAAMLLVFARRYVEAAAIADAVLGNPALAWLGSHAVVVKGKPDAYVVDVARDVADAIMGKAAPSLSNTLKPQALAKTFLALHLQSVGRGQSLEGHLLKAFDPMIGAQWPAMRPPAAIDLGVLAQPRWQRPAKHRRAL